MVWLRLYMLPLLQPSGGSVRALDSMMSIVWNAFPSTGSRGRKSVKEALGPPTAWRKRRGMAWGKRQLPCATLTIISTFASVRFNKERNRERERDRDRERERGRERERERLREMCAHP